jgi:phosphoglycolate phosphatase
MMSAKRFDLVIFDLDGTLVDSVPDIAWSLNATLAEAGYPSLPIETVTRFVGDGATKLLERAIAPSPTGMDLEPLLARFLAHYADHLCVGTRLYSGITDLLDALSRTGIASAVVTNKPTDLARRLLEILAVDDRFVAVIGDGDGYPRKPDPAAARSILTRVGAQPERAMVVGDGLPDVRMAHAVPCPVIAATWGYVPRDQLQGEFPTFLAHSPQEVAHILARVTPER